MKTPKQFNNITPFRGLYLVFNLFSTSSLRKTIDFHLGRRSSNTIERTFRGPENFR